MTLDDRTTERLRDVAGRYGYADPLEFLQDLIEVEGDVERLRAISPKGTCGGAAGSPMGELRRRQADDLSGSLPIDEAVEVFRQRYRPELTPEAWTAMIQEERAKLDSTQSTPATESGEVTEAVGA